MRALGLDLGAKRIGVAVSDRAGRLATPADVLHRTGDRARDHRAVADLVVEWEAEVVGVGGPYSLDGGTGPAAEAMTAESRQLARARDVPVETHDERLTTVSAERRLREAGLDSRAQRKVVDQVAAAVLLQAWLDGRSEGSVS